MPGRSQPSCTGTFRCLWLLCVFLLFAGCKDPGPPPELSATDAESTLQAVVVPVEWQKWPTIVRSQGSLVADENVQVGTKVAGRVEMVHVDLGDTVQAGDPLVSLDQQEYRFQVEQAQAQLAQARAAVGLREGDEVDQLEPSNAAPVRQEQALWDEAKANLARARRLQSQNVIPQAEFDQFEAAERVAEARYASAVNAVREKIALIQVREAELSLARDRLDNAIIRAPFDGLVQQRQVAPGGYLQAGASVAVLVRCNPLRFQGAIPERHAQRLAPGQEVRLLLESEAEPRIVRITRISPALDTATRSLMFEAEVANENGQLRSGLFSEAEVIIDPQAEALVVPSSAIVEFAGTEKVWQVSGDKAEEQPVVTGRRRAGTVEVVQGLKPGDEILLEGNQGRVATVERLQPSDRAVQSGERAQLSDGSNAPSQGEVPTRAVSG